MKERISRMADAKEFSANNTDAVKAKKCTNQPNPGQCLTPRCTNPPPCITPPNCGGAPPPNIRCGRGSMIK